MIPTATYNWNKLTLQQRREEQGMGRESSHPSSARPANNNKQYIYGTRQTINSGHLIIITGTELGSGPPKLVGIITLYPSRSNGPVIQPCQAPRTVQAPTNYKSSSPASFEHPLALVLWIGPHLGSITIHHPTLHRAALLCYAPQLCIFPLNRHTTLDSSLHISSPLFQLIGWNCNLIPNVLYFKSYF